MPGGLIQIASYGNQDLFLTGNPEITYFKTVYRRYTNFAIESIEVLFDDKTGFGQTSHIVIPKNGDLIYKTYIKIILPAISLYRKAYYDSSMDEYRDAIYSATGIDYENFNKVKTFMGVNMLAYRNAYQCYIAVNKTIQDMIDAVSVVFATQMATDPTKITNFEYLVGETIYGTVGLDRIINPDLLVNNPSITKEQAYALMQSSYNRATFIQNQYFELYKLRLYLVNDVDSNKALFAWVNKVGHAVLQSFQIEIGGHAIDKSYGDWLNIWTELTNKYDMETTYNKMIGNVSDLTDYNRDPKSEYTMYVPLQFWFCRHNGLAIPLVTLEHHDVSLTCTFRNIDECCYIGDILAHSDGSINTVLELKDILNDYIIDLSASLYVDYVYLSSQERKRFAQSSHEYLFEQLQLYELELVAQKSIQVELDFLHPCKEFIWVVQKDDYIQNNDGMTQCQWDNYSLTQTYEGNPIISSAITFNGYSRVGKFNGNFYNYVQPYCCHTRTPSDGINMYSFSLRPEEYQPSGQCEASRINRILLYLELDDELYTDVTTNIRIRVYATNWNVLRFINGMGGYAFIT